MKRLLFALVICSSLFGANTVIYGIDDKTPNAAKVDKNGALHVIPDNFLIDGFGRMSVSEPTTLFDSKQIHDNLPLFWDEITNGNGSNIYQNTHAATFLSVAGDGDYAIRQTKMRMNYQPGKSHQVLMTACFSNGVENVVKRVGYFNTLTNAPFTNQRDGFWIEQEGTNIYLVVSKLGVENRVVQSNWDDPLDGITSQYTFDFTKTFIIQWRMEWLGVGSLVCYIIIDGVPVEIHRFNHAGIREMVYIKSPNHSLRYEIFSTGGQSCLQHICSSVASEGGSELLGTIRYISTAGSEITATNENARYGIIAIRLKTNYIDTTIRLLDIAIQIQSATHKLEWTLVLNPTLSGVVLFSDLTNSALQYSILDGGQVATGGFEIGGGFLESGGRSSGIGSTARTIENALRLGETIDGVRDYIVMVVRPVGGSSGVDVEGAIFWREQL